MIQLIWSTLAEIVFIAHRVSGIMITGNILADMLESLNLEMILKVLMIVLLSVKPKKADLYRERTSKGSDNRQKTGTRERNVAHPNGEEHSRVPKGNRSGFKRIEMNPIALDTEKLLPITIITVTTVFIVVLIADDATGIGIGDNCLLTPAFALWWDMADKLMV